MTYGLIGTGPVGCTLGAHLVKAGQRVSVFCIEPEKTVALRQKPLAIRGALDADVRMDEIHDNLKDFLQAAPEVILLATKSCHSAQVLDEIRHCAPRLNSLFVSCQNGLDVERYIEQRFGTDRMLRMILHFGCGFKTLNEIQVFFSHTHVLSDRGEVNSSLKEKLIKDFNDGGFPMVLQKDYRTEAFKKAILNASLSTVCSLTGLTMKDALEDPNIKKVVKDMVREAIGIAQAEGLAVGNDFEEYAMNYFAKGGHHKPSMLVDIENGRKTENEDLCGRMVELANQRSLAVPVVHTAYAFMRNLEKRILARGNA
ncbi:MAG: ketopantoate reductase family protein [Deltaproteobacteria bacterium]|nr:ketopantoate reductase family protein [Deltaproteobacteria bacterium]